MSRYRLLLSSDEWIMLQHQAMAGIVLAAGASSRMGRPKQLLPYRGKPLLQHVLDLVGSVDFLQRVLVLGHAASVVLARCVADGYTLISNPDYAQGHSTSIKAGLESLDPRAQGAFFFLADQPLVKASTIQALASAYERTGASIAVPVYQGRRGNPVFFHRRLFAEILSVTGDTGPRKLFATYAQDLMWVEVQDPGTVLDVDTWEDYHRLP